MGTIKVLVIDSDTDFISELKKYFNNRNIDIVYDDSNGDVYRFVIKKSLTKILHELGVPSNIKGYQYIKESILLLYENKELEKEITKSLYPSIARLFSTTVSCVERLIRHAIDISWNRGNLDVMEEIFGHSIDIEKCKPTNSQFIITIADMLRMDYYKNMEV